MLFRSETQVQVAERLDLGRPKDETDIYKKRDTTQVSSFLSLLNVSEKSRDFAGWGWEGLPKIPFTTISILSSSFSHEDQDKIIQSALQGEKKSSILKSDAIKLRKWKNANPNLVIEEGIEKVEWQTIQQMNKSLTNTYSSIRYVIQNYQLLPN